MEVAQFESVVDENVKDIEGSAKDPDLKHSGRENRPEGVSRRAAYVHDRSRQMQLSIHLGARKDFKRLTRDGWMEHVDDDDECRHGVFLQDLTECVSTRRLRALKNRGDKVRSSDDQFFVLNLIHHSDDDDDRNPEAA